MDDIIFKVLNNYTFIYILMPMIGALLCMLCNSANTKDHQIPMSFEKKWKKDFFDVTNFLSIWLIIMLIMQAYKGFLKNIWGIN